MKTKKIIPEKVLIAEINQLKACDYQIWSSLRVGLGKTERQEKWAELCRNYERRYRLEKMVRYAAKKRIQLLLKQKKHKHQSVGPRIVRLQKQLKTPVAPNGQWLSKKWAEFVRQ